MLFDAVTKRADREGVKCYLESSKSVPNVQIYERMGFEMKREMECSDGEDVCMVCPLGLILLLRWFLTDLLFSYIAWFGILRWCDLIQYDKYRWQSNIHHSLLRFADNSIAACSRVILGCHTILLVYFTGSKLSKLDRHF